MKDRLARIMAAAIFKGYICVQEGLLDLIDAVLPQPDDNYPAAEDNYGHHRMQWPRIIAQHYLDPSLPGDCNSGPVSALALETCSGVLLLSMARPVAAAAAVSAATRHSFGDSATNLLSW